MKRSFFLAIGSLSLATTLVVACADDDANVGSQGNNATVAGSAGKGGSTAGTGGTATAGTGGTTTAGTGGSTTGGSGGSTTGGSGGSTTGGSGGSTTGGAAGANPGKPCGGLAGIACEADEVCEYAIADMCGAADHQGTCTKRPLDCGDGCAGPSGAPCACDGKRYCSTCEILKAGLSPAPDSVCNGGAKACGGLGNPPCGATEFCDYPNASMCGVADGTGICKPKPTECGEGCPAPEFQPCACDGQKYCNTCEINKQGLSVAPASFCNGGGGAGGAGGSGGGSGGSGGAKSCGGLGGGTCGADEVCSYTLEAMCGAADATGFCKPKPSECGVGCPAPDFQPCACDGQKYCNECEINKKGLSVAPASFCK